MATRLTIRDFGTCINCSGSSQDIDLGNSFQYTSSSFSISGWIKDFLPSAGSFFFTTRVGSIPNQGYEILLNANSVYGSITARACGADGTSFATSETKIYKATQWNNVILVLNRTNNTLYCYVNGSLNGSTSISTLTTITNGQNLKIANRNGTYYKLKADDLRIYSKALSSQEVFNLYYRDEYISNLEGWYKFDEGSGSVAIDSSGNGRNGTINSATYSSDVFMIPRTVI